MMVLGVDGGLATLGWAQVRILDGAVLPVALSALRTAPSRGVGAGVTASEDALGRALHLGERLRDEALRPPSGFPRLTVLVVEGLSHVQSAGAAAKIALGLGVVLGVAAMAGMRLVSASPQEVRAALGVPRGLHGAEGKCAVRTALGARFGAPLEALLGPVPVGLRQHALDALAVVCTCADRNRLAALKGGMP